MQKTFSFFGLIAGTIFTMLIFVSYSTIEENPGKSVDADPLPQKVKAIKFDNSFNWCGEIIPSDNFDLMERLDRELLVNSYWQSNTVMFIKLANRYFPTIEKILAEEGVPDDFKYLAVAESGLRNVTSPARAKGFWQFRKLAAKDYNLEVNSEVDERYHLEKSTRAACGYIKYLKERFGSWVNAAAAYNMGPGNFSKATKEQGEENYFDLNINQESSRYVFRLVAIKEILNDPQSFGFYVDFEDMYAPLDNYTEVPVEETVLSWTDFAKEHGISYRMLKVYNPWLRDTKLTVKKNKYLVKVPKQ